MRNVANVVFSTSDVRVANVVFSTSDVRVANVVFSTSDVRVTNAEHNTIKNLENESQKEPYDHLKDPHMWAKLSI